MKPNTHKNCGGKYEKKKSVIEGNFYVCNRCGRHYVMYKKSK